MTWTYLDGAPPYGFAHRGGQGPAPENTVGAFSRAVELGYRYLETDVHTTADGQLVAFHDDDLERVAGLAGRISDHSWNELSEIDLGDGHRIPRLTDLLQSFPEARFNIDPKSDDAVQPLVEIVADHDAVDRVCIGSFSDDRIQQAQQALGPRLCTSPGPKGAMKVMAAAWLGLRWNPPFGCVQIPVAGRGVRLDSATLIRRIQSLGMQVHFWTINDADEMNRLLDRGADAIITDEIELLKEVLIARGNRL